MRPARRCFDEQHSQQRDARGVLQAFDLLELDGGDDWAAPAARGGARPSLEVKGFPVQRCGTNLDAGAWRSGRPTLSIGDDRICRHLLPRPW